MRRYITDTEWRLFFEAISGSKTELRDKAMFKMAYRHGLRVSELTGLRMTDLDLSGKTLFIRRLKNGFSTIHPLQDETYHLISAWLDIRQALVTKENHWLFVSVDGKRLSRQWIYKLSQKYGNKSGVSVQIHPHMLRHACGYALANQGLDTRLRPAILAGPFLFSMLDVREILQ
ncbi:tyrosine-type recombinase/integrase [Salmonella enterica subsp. enterica serovar Typhimurium]|nr:tyrosine-type recombinase/integrase [Salmonella enterica subsp. enterica serovar Typhimurium]EHO4930169.1 tyrosine-type recombinase/integrase [Salmonella enterica subsp. enterica serovar Bispebjerg]EHP5061011.1 tyrosine-type recombinase/integrase [Salmonella enterica]EHA9426219.1 tyrosine-type recombinase/integrase [Salmonella enterica subsp. enterica serovar Typhimurium]EIC0191189.1 tyrosine-type recombinase/integrase [Salmonella enterica subsp. enterica serovar Bispebjerg]